MSTPPFRRYTRRDRTSARDQNALRQRVEDAARSAPPSGGGLHALSRAGAQILVSDVAGPVWLRIDGGPAGTDRYESWTEVIDDGSGNFGPVGDDGLAGSPDLPAWLVAGAAPAVGDVILAWWSEDRESLLFEGPPGAASGTLGGPVTNNYGPYLTWHFTGPNVFFTGDMVEVQNGFCHEHYDCYSSRGVTLSSTSDNTLTLSTADPWLKVQTSGSGLYPVSDLSTPGGACDGCEVLVTNTGPGSLVLVNGGAILTPTASNWKLPPLYSAWFRYDRAAVAWRLVATRPDVMLGAASGADGREGLVPQPLAGEQAKFLRGDGVWAAAAGLTSPLTTKGDVWVYSTADTRLAVGTNGQVLTADSTQATGLKWAAAGGAFSGARATRTAGTSSGPGTSLSGTVAFDAEDYDTSSYHDTATNNSRLTAPSTGKYRIGAFFGGNVGGVVSYNVLVTLRKNGTTLLAAARYQSSSAGEDGDLCLAADVPLNSGDYFEVTWNFSSSGSTTFTVAASTSAWVEKRD